MIYGLSPYRQLSRANTILELFPPLPPPAAGALSSWGATSNPQSKPAEPLVQVSSPQGAGEGKQGRALSAGDRETIPLVLFSWRDAFLRHNTEFPQSSEPRIFSCSLIKNMTLSLKLAFVLKRSCLPGELIPLTEVTSLEVLLLSSISWLR